MMRPGMIAERPTCDGCPPLSPGAAYVGTVEPCREMDAEGAWVVRHYCEPCRMVRDVASAERAP